MKSRQAGLLGAFVVALIFTAFDWWYYRGGPRGFTSWPAQLILPAVWPKDWLIWRDPSLFRWVRLIFWVSNVVVWTLVLFVVSQVGFAVRAIGRRSHA